MKNLLLLFIAALFTTSGIAQNDIILHINHTYGDAPFALYDVATAPDGNEFYCYRLEYYISGIVVTHDGGQVMEMDDVYILANGADEGIYYLGEADITEVENIQFSIGVDEANNHLDPSLYDPEHPLAPQAPSMHWGWEPGYRFLAVEGKAGTNFSYTFEVHALGDENYFNTNIDVVSEQNGNDVEIYLNADYTQLFHELNLSSGLIYHGTGTDATTILDNTVDYVFSAGTSSNISEIETEISVSIAPNPSLEIAELKMALITGNNYLVQVIDESGRLISKEVINSETKVYTLPEVNAGIYLVTVFENGRAVFNEHWMSIR